MTNKTNSVILLSICIPTYNREREIKETLDRLMPQITPEVEVVVSDNCSEDNTEVLLKNYAVRYSRNLSNLGYDRNVDKCLNLAQGEYIWLLSSDELLQDEAVEFVLSTIKMYPGAGWICINDKEKGRTYIQNGQEYIQSNGLVGGLISQNIFKKKAIPINRVQYYGNFWIHLSIGLEILKKSSLVLIKNLFIPKESFCTWAKGGKSFYTYISLKNIVHANGYKINFDWGFPKVMLSAKKRGLKFTLDHAKMIMREFKCNPIVMVIALIILLIPPITNENINL